MRTFENGFLPVNPWSIDGSGVTNVFSNESTRFTGFLSCSIFLFRNIYSDIQDISKS